MKNSKLSSVSFRVGALALAAFAALSTSAAMAQDVAGWYGGASAGRANAEIDKSLLSDGLTRNGVPAVSIGDRSSDTAFKVFGGYQLNRNIAIEGGLFDLGSADYATTSSLPSTVLNGSTHTRGMNLDLVGTLPLTDRLSALGRVGVTRSESKEHFTGAGAFSGLDTRGSTRSTNAKIGLGLQYAVTDTLSLRGEIERYRVRDGMGSRGHVDTATLGLVYLFGAKPSTYVAVAPAAAWVPVVQTVVEAPVVVIPAPVAPRFEKYTLSATELFGFDSAVLQPNEPKLDEVAAALRINSAISNVVITGYTDHLGGSAYNQKLSERRAIAVKGYLVGKGVESNRLNAQGKGESNPIATCAAKNLPLLIKCLEPNRRVEVESITVDRRLP